MLVDIIPKPLDETMSIILSFISKKDMSRLFCGVYEVGHWNFEQYIDTKNNYPDLGDFDCFGVCDSPEQLISIIPDEVVKSGNRKFVISMVKINKSQESKDGGGWRWHKWGTYVGNQNPQCEYLADEPLIDMVWTYHIYEIV